MSGCSGVVGTVVKLVRGVVVVIVVAISGDGIVLKVREETYYRVESSRVAS